MNLVKSLFSTQWRSWTTGLVLLLLLLMVGGYSYHQVEVARFRQEKYEDIATIGRLKAEAIQQWRLNLLSNVSTAARNPFLKNSLVAWHNTSTNPELRADSLLRLRLEQEAHDYEAIIFLDANATVLLAAGTQVSPLHPHIQQTVQTALTQHKALLSEPYRSSDGRILIDTVVAMPEPPQTLLAFQTDAGTYFRTLLRAWPTASRSAEIALIRRDGDSVLFMNELRHQANSALTLRIPLSRSDLPAAQAVLGQHGLFQGKDYRGIDVLADLRPIADSPWFLVAKVDSAEILLESRYRANTVIVFVSLCILLAAALIAAAYRQRQATLYQTLYQSERQQREAQQQFRAILYSIGDAVITTDASARVRQMNLVAEQLTGWSEREACGQPLQQVFNIINEDTRHPVENPVNRVLREGVIVGLANHTLLIARDGSERPIADSGAPIRDETHSISGVVLVFRDQSAERAAEAEIRRNEARMRSLASILQYPADSVQDFLEYALQEAIQLTGSQVGYLYRYDENRREFSLNARSYEMLPIATNSGPKAYYPLDKAGILGEAVRQRRAIIINDFSAPHPLKSGFPEGHAPLHNYLTLPVLSAEHMVGILGIANKSTDYHETDILQLQLLMEAVWRVVERREAEDKERQAVHSLQMLSHCNKVIALAEEEPSLLQNICQILTTEGGWRMAWVGVAEAAPGQRVRPVAWAGFEQGYLQDIVITCDDSASGHGPAGRAIRTAQPVICQNLRNDPHLGPWREQALKRGYNALIALPLQRKTSVWGVLTLYSDQPDAIGSTEVRLLRRLADNLAYALGVLHIKAAGQRALQKQDVLEAQLRQAQKMEAVGRLAGGIAHDFNNMLAVISGHTDLALEQASPNSPIAADLLEIQKAAKRSADLTRQLLAFARKQTITPKVLDLNDTIAGMLKMLKRLIGEDIELFWKPASRLWRIKVDPAQIDQILANLIVNARDAISNIGKITIETSQALISTADCTNFPGLMPGAYVFLTVSDNGCGMDPATLAQVFDPFFTTKPAGQGTGLGLATVYGIVKQNQGFISIDSHPGQGTTVKIHWPRHIAEEMSVRITQPRPSLPTGTETLLLVEDEAALLKLGARLLERLGYTVLTAGHPDQALQLTATYAEPIHLLITDVIMPGMSGHQLWQQLNSVRPGLKCLFMSGHTANVIADHGVLDDGIHFLQKPFSREGLAAKVREALTAA